MEKFYQEVERELNEHILPFWMKLKDKQNGGFYGEVDVDLTLNKQADKGGIATARFLWTFSAAYRITHNSLYLEYADHLYDFLINKLYDYDNLGLYWSVDYQGNPKDTRKHVYVQSFGIYALSEYYRVTKNEAALNLAMELFRLIEEKGFSKATNAYMEEFDKKWTLVPNEMLSENNVLADITMNTHIHVLEAYTNLYKAWPNQYLKERLVSLLDVHYKYIYNHETSYLDVFFDNKWDSILDIQSFGHDIEASWLINAAMDVIGVKNEDYSKMITDIAYNILNNALQDDGSLMNERVNGKVDTTRIWWVQAETIVGFYNAFEKTKDRKFLEAVKGLWNYIKENIVDKRPNSEWYWSVDEFGNPSTKNIGDPWKASYHNSRFCLELIERVKNE